MLQAPRFKLQRNIKLQAPKGPVSKPCTDSWRDFWYLRFGSSLVLGACLHSFVIVSSRFKIARLTIAQAATLCMFTFGGKFVEAEPTLSASVVRSSK